MQVKKDRCVERKFAKIMKDDIMSVSEQEKAQLFQCERRMAIMIAAKQLQAQRCQSWYNKR